MHHSFIDRYSDLKSPIHAWDARLKAITCIILIICIVSLPAGRFVALLTYTAILLACWFSSGIPGGFLLKRLMLILPFVVVMTISIVWSNVHTHGANRFSIFIFIIIRASAAITALTLLMSTTPFPNFLAALCWLRLPKVILSLMSFLYNFVYIIVDEFERLGMGRKSRDFGSGLVLAWRSRAWMVGTFLIRAFERSERVYQSMLARGYEGKILTSTRMRDFRPREIWISAFSIAAMALIRIGVTG